MQSCRSESTTCPRKGLLLRFKSNSAATSDGSAQKLGIYVSRDSELITIKVCSQIARKWNAMFESHVVFRFFQQSAFVNIPHDLLCYWPTIHNLILKICPNYQVISSHFFEVVELLDVHWAKWKLCKVEIIQFQSMLNAIRCTNHRFAFKNSRILWMALIFNLKNNLSLTVPVHAKKSVAGGEIWLVIYRFFQHLIQMYGLLVKVSSSEYGDLGSIPD